jgi:serine/threonine-protein kinase RsbW
MSNEPGNNKDKRTVVIPSDAIRGLQVQSDILHLAQTHQYSERELFAIRLSVEEAVVNAIKHGNGSDPSKSVRIDYEVNHELVWVRIEDEGPGFDPAQVPDPTSPEFIECPSGRGLLLMRYYMSEVQHSARGNCVEMVKRRGEARPDDT